MTNKIAPDFEKTSGKATVAGGPKTKGTVHTTGQKSAPIKKSNGGQADD